MRNETMTDIIFCWVFTTLGAVAFTSGLDAVLNTNYHGMGLMIAIAGLIMIGVSATESGKL
jgi:Zn-dependent alcohol dehydrogenase